MTTLDHKKAKAGDLVVVSGHHQGEPERVGEILEVRVGGVTSFLVRWEDEHEAIVYPAEDAIVRPGHGSTKK